MNLAICSYHLQSHDTGMDCSICVFRSRSLASCSANPEQSRAKSNDGSDLDHDGRSQRVVEMFEDLTLFDAQIALAAGKSGIYICRADEPKLRLSPGCCIRDWKVQTCLRTKTFKTSGLLGPASLASLVAVNVVSIQIGKPWLTRPKNGRHVDGTWTHTWNLIVDILATVAAACSDHLLRSDVGRRIGSYCEDTSL